MQYNMVLAYSIFLGRFLFILEVETGKNVRHSIEEGSNKNSHLRKCSH